MIRAEIFYGIGCCVAHFIVRINSQQEVQECDATGDEHCDVVGFIKIIYLTIVSFMTNRVNAFYKLARLNFKA